MSFTQEWLPSSHSTLSVWLKDCYWVSYFWPNNQLSEKSWWFQIPFSLKRSSTPQIYFFPLFKKNHRWVSMNLWLGACFDIHCELWGVRYTDVGLWQLSAIYSICLRRTLVLSLSNEMSYYYTDALLAIKIHLDMKSFTRIRVWGFIVY